MLDIYIDYNPYTVTTDVKVNGEPYSRSTLFDSMNSSRLQSWIEPHRGWRGFFKELKDAYGESQVLIRFHGNAYDYADLEYAKDKYGSDFKCVEMEHINKDTCTQSAPIEKLAEIRRLYEELQNGPIEEFKSPEIRSTFESAINSDFEIVVVAPFSSGKSTLINAILGRDLLPALNQATTAVITTIRDNDNAEDFTISAKDNNNNPLCFQINTDGSFKEDEKGNYILDPTGKRIQNVPATAKLIEQVNLPFVDTVNDNGESVKIARASKVEIEGDIPSLPSSNLNTVFIDTPGGNNALNSEHEKIMDEAIHNPNKSLILYIINGKNASSCDSNIILNKIAKEMKDSSDGKLSQDRFLFVANNMDIDAAKEPYQDFIDDTLLKMLTGKGIERPNFFLTSALAAKLIRMAKANIPLSEDEGIQLYGFRQKFKGQNNDGTVRDLYSLYKYSTLSDRQKEEFANQIESLLREKDLDSIAEINSGIPALETAIREYVEKYAICIKVKNARDSFMIKIKEKKLIDSKKEEWNTSEQALEKIQKELDEKENEYKKNENLANFRARIDHIEIDETPIKDISIQLRHALDQIRKTHDKEVKKEQSEVPLQKIRNDIESACENSGTKVLEAINKSVIVPCNRIVSEYQACIQDMDDKGLLNLGGISIKTLNSFKDLNIDSVAKLLGDTDYTVVRTEKVATKTYKKSGFFNLFKRFFGTGGWGKEDIMEDIEYIDMPKIVGDLAIKLSNEFDLQVRKYIKKAQADVEHVKDVAREKLDSVDQRIQSLIKDLRKSTLTRDILAEEVAQNKLYEEWMDNFISKMDSILKIK